MYLWVCKKTLHLIIYYLIIIPGYLRPGKTLYLVYRPWAIRMAKMVFYQEKYESATKPPLKYAIAKPLCSDNKY